MSSEHERLWRGKLRYFGSMGAGISHEIRNCLATINEKTGLMGDLLSAASDGRALNTARLEALTLDIARLVERVNLICGRLSHLSHSPDNDVKEVDLGSIITLVAELLRRPAADHRVEITVDTETKASLVVDPVMLQYCLSLVLDWGIVHAPEALLDLRILEQDGHVGAVLSGAPFLELTKEPSAELAEVLAELDAKLSPVGKAHDIVLLLPKKREVS